LAGTVHAKAMISREDIIWLGVAAGVSGGLIGGLILLLSARAIAGARIKVGGG